MNNFGYNNPGGWQPQNYNPNGYSPFAPTTYQGVQRPQASSFIPGRTINTPDDIMPQEVPMDGSVSLFPTNDFSAIYAKTWTKDGTIATMKFIPEKQETAPTPNLLEEKINKIDKRISSLENRMNKFAKSRKNEEEPNE